MKSICRYAIRITLAVLAVAAAAQNAGAQTAEAPAAGKPQTASAAKELYRMAAGDVVEIRFFFDPELNEQVQIRPDGRISMQLIGEVKLEGKTVEEVSRELERAYSQHLKSPTVLVQLRSFASQKVYVTGEVLRPGIIGLPGEMTLLAAISEAGGIKPTGNVKSVVLIRKGPDDRPEARKIVLRDGNKFTADAGLLLRPYDIVLVPETKIARLDRWVDQHIRQLIPGNMVLGFSYVLNNAGSGSLIPF